MGRVLRNRLLDEVDGVDALYAANACSTFARVLERPLPGHPNPPAPLKSKERLMGIPGLSREVDHKVEVANSLLKSVARLMELVHQNGGATALENPANSWIWACRRFSDCSAQTTYGTWCSRDAHAEGRGIRWQVAIQCR